MNGYNESFQRKTYIRIKCFIDPSIGLPKLGGLTIMSRSFGEVMNISQLYSHKAGWDNGDCGSEQNHLLTWVEISV